MPLAHRRGQHAKPQIWCSRCEAMRAAKGSMVLPGERFPWCNACITELKRADKEHRKRQRIVLRSRKRS